MKRISKIGMREKLCDSREDTSTIPAALAMMISAPAFTRSFDDEYPDRTPTVKAPTSLPSVISMG